MDYDKRGGWNIRGGWNKGRGWNIFIKSINVEGGFFCGGGSLSKSVSMMSRLLEK